LTYETHYNDVDIRTIDLYPLASSSGTYSVRLNVDGGSNEVWIYNIEFIVPIPTFVLPSTTAYAVDANGDGFDDYIRAEFDVNLNEPVTAQVTVKAFLRDSNGHVVDSEYITYDTTWIQQDVHTLTLYPTNLAGPDTYSVRLVVNDGVDEVIRSNIYFHLNTIPVAIAGPDRDIQLEKGQETVTITFDGSASYDPDGTIVAYVWDFGDGTTGTGPTPTHTFSAGTYTVRLTVMDNDGGTHTDTLIVRVRRPAPAFELLPLIAAFGVAILGLTLLARQRKRN
jgi:PKD repeat protein